MSLDADYQAAIDDGAFVIEVITEDINSSEADQDDLVEWADTYGLTMPVVSDPQSEYMWSLVNGTSVGLPFMALLDRGAVIETSGSFSATVDDAVDLAQN